MTTTKQYISAYWYISNNFGDNLNHFLIRAISGKDVVYDGEKKSPHFIVCGSILREANENSNVWGAGFGDTWQWQQMDAEASIVSVRGYKSAELLQKSREERNLPLYEFKKHGDPAVLLPMFYFPKREAERHKTGIIPHYSDYARCLRKYSDKHHIIDPFLPVGEFIEQVVSCEKIVSSSLHGLIVADAYSVPNRWLELPSLAGDGFKFKDYYSTTHERESLPLRDISFEECMVHHYEHDKYLFLTESPFFNAK